MVSADGSAVAFETAESTYPLAKRVGQMTVVVRDLATDPVERVSHAYEPSVSRDGRLVAFTSRARNLGAAGHAEVYVRDLRRGTTRLVTGAITGDAGSPSLSADGRYVAFLKRVGRPNGTAESLRSQVWRHDLRTGRQVLVTRATGARGVPADGYATDPAISADGRRVAFASTAGNLAEAKPDGLAGVFVRDLARGTTTLLSSHPRRAGSDSDLVKLAVPTGSAIALGLGGLVLLRRRKGIAGVGRGPRAA